MSSEKNLLAEYVCCQKKIKQLKKDILTMALESFSSEVPGGTYAQMLAVAEVVAEKERQERFVWEVRQFLKDLPCGMRALLVAVYCKHIPCEDIAKRYGVSPSTVYRKLARSKKTLQNKLEELSKSDFSEVFSFLEGLREPGTQ